MTDTNRSTLVKLGDTEFTVADRSEDVRGRRVLDQAGDEIGEMSALLIDDQEMKVRFLQVASGGFLGIGARHFLIPVDAVTRIDGDHVHVDQTRDRVAASPAYDPDLTYDDTYYGGVYGYYGYPPYWAPGYVYAGSPLYY